MNKTDLSIPDLKPMTTPSTEESLRDYRKHIEKLKREAIQASALLWEQSLRLIGGQPSDDSAEKATKKAG